MRRRVGLKWFIWQVTGLALSFWLWRLNFLAFQKTCLSLEDFAWSFGGFLVIKVDRDQRMIENVIDFDVIYTI